ncbi:histone-lysine N-methyltransferase, H3 lysine-9 specific SUVH5-like [Henckelia pumila]|uniref:histone-lysine N-methyltransferase, H3 lysine-9 specific SUVH5-like n=1 Tax=Henckelia pumila TaxID=405737 RepID=UPI003C6DF51C
MAAAESSPKKQLPANGKGKFKSRPKPCAVRDFPRNCGPSKPNTATHSLWFKNMETPKILDDISKEMGGQNEQKLGLLEAVWENALEKVAEIIALAREFYCCFGENALEKVAEIIALALQKPLLEAMKTVEDGVVSKILFEGVDGQYFGEKFSEIGVGVQEKNNTEGEGVVGEVLFKSVYGNNMEENFGEGGANMDLRRVREKVSTGTEMEWDDLGDEFMETEGEGVVGEILSKSVGGQNMDEKGSEKDPEGGPDMNLRSVQEKDNTGLGLEWQDLGDDFYVLSSQGVKFGGPCFEKGLRAKALMTENHAKLDGDGADVVGYQGTDIIVLEDDDCDGEVSISERKGKVCRENLQEPKFVGLDRYEVEKEQDESMGNFTTGDNLACVECKDSCNDQPKSYRTLEELVNSCIVKHDRPEGCKVREALLKFEEYFKALQRERKKRKAEMGEEKKGKNNAHIEAAGRVKAEGMWISVRKPFGHIPGIEIGDTFRFRAQLAVVGLHRQMMCGIDYVTIGDEKFATCVVDSGRYENEAKPNDSLIYSGQGGNPKLVDKAADQKLIKGNLAMVNSMEMRYPVRVIRKRMTGMESHVFGHFNDSKYLYLYDGLYMVTNYWQDRDENGSLVFKFELTRMPGQPRPRQTVAKYGKFLPRKEICIIYDVSQGLENRPIRVMNGIDDLRPPPFAYINKIIYPEWYRGVESVGCDCVNGCSDSHQCPCVVRNGGEIPFNEKGSIVRSRTIVYECGPNCKCPPSCMSRVSQHGPRIQLEIFKTKERGWGLRTRDYVTSGSFICEYIGELLQEKEAEQRIGEDEYLFDIGDGHEEYGELEGLVDSGNHDVFAIDAGKFGNVGRFVKHSCSPNMYAQEVLYDHYDKKMPHIMFFATRNIPALHELTCNYNYKIDRVCDVNGNIKKKHCFCGSRNCKGRMY